MTSLGFVFIFNLGFSQTIFFILYVVVVDFLVAGLVAATSMWLIANKFLKEQNADGDIEWGYSFDVHINAFFPPLVILHFIQLIFYKVLFSQEWFLARFMGNTLWLLSIGYYIYITFLGYNCMFHTIFIVIDIYLNLFNSRHIIIKEIKDKIDFGNVANCIFGVHRHGCYWMELIRVIDEFLSLSSTLNYLFFKLL